MVMKKIPKSTKLAALLAGTVMLGLVTQSAMALTSSGTIVSNTAALAYVVGGVTQTPITTAAATFTVDNKINVVVSGGIIKSVIPGQTSAVTPFVVTNNGNASQGYALTAANAAVATYTVNGASVVDNVDTSLLPQSNIYLDSNGDGTLSAGELAAGPITSIATLAPGASVSLLVKTDILLSSANNDAAVVSLQAATTWPTPLVGGEEPVGATAGGAVNTTTYPQGGINNAGVDVVFADAAGVATGDVANNGAHSTYGAFKVNAAVLSVVKTVSVICDPINGSTSPKNIPGAIVQYAVTITNGVGAQPATLTSVTDALVSSLGFSPVLISGAGAGSACTSGTGVSLSASGFSAVSGAGVVTTYASPGVAGQATTAGATFTSPNVNINFATLASPVYSLVGGVLPANSFVTVYFDAIVQ